MVFTAASGDCTVSFDPAGSIQEVLYYTREQPLTGPGGFHVQEVLRPNGSVQDLGYAQGEISGKDNNLHFKGAVANAALSIEADITGGDYIDVSGVIRDSTGCDRAVYVSCVLPVQLEGWTWHSTAFKTRIIQPGDCFPSRPEEMIYLGKRGQSFSDEDHEVYDIAVSRLPFNAVTMADMGVAVACPLHEPRVFLIKASDKGIGVTFSLGLTQETEKFPCRAAFRCIIYTVDPEWGIRSAAEKYYLFFSELFETEAVKHGNFSGFWKPEKEETVIPDNPEDFSLMYVENDYQWTDGEMSEQALDLKKKLGVEVFHWREPWSWFHDVGADMSPDEELAFLQAQAAGEQPGGHGTNQYCSAPPEEGAKAALNSYIINHEGKLERNIHTYECWSLPMNLDPSLPKPNRGTLALDWQFRWLEKWKDPEFRGPRNFAWDSLDDWSGFRRLNFRREHFTCSDIPVTFDPSTGELCQIVGFHDWSFAKHHSELIRNAEGLVMANINLEHAMMYCGSHLDVFVRERNVKDYDNERLSVIRMLAGKKPVSFLGSWQPREPEEREKVVRRLMLFGIFPGSEKAEHERTLYKKYMPVLAGAAEAGWEPVTYARSDDILIERFGQQRGALFFTLENKTPRSVKGIVSIELDSLDISAQADDIVFREILEDREVKVQYMDTGTVQAEIEFKPGETLVLSVM